MPMVPLSVTLSPNIEEVSADLLHMAAVCRDLTQFFRSMMIPELLRDIRANIESEGDNVGGWPPTSPAYEEWKERSGHGDKMGVFSGALYNSFNPSMSSRWLKITTTPTSATVESLLPHAAKFNEARRVIPAPEQLDQLKYIRLLEQWLEFQFGVRRGLQRKVSPYSDLFELSGGKPAIQVGGPTRRRRKRADTGKARPQMTKAARNAVRIQKLREALARKTQRAAQEAARKAEQDELSRLIREQESEMGGGRRRRRGGFDDTTEFHNYAGGYDDMGRRRRK